MKRVAVLIGVMVGSMATLGCRSDAQSCEDICVTSDDCDDSAHIDMCIDECERNTEYMDDGCAESFHAMAECMDFEEHDCTDSVDACDSEIEDFWEDCDDDFEHFEYANPFIEAVDNDPTPL